MRVHTLICKYLRMLIRGLLGMGAGAHIRILSLRPPHGTCSSCRVVSKRYHDDETFMRIRYIYTCVSTCSFLLLQKDILILS